MAESCPHLPKCPVGTATWKCAKRTAIWYALEQHVLSEREVFALLTRYGLPLTPPKRAYRGEARCDDRMFD